MRTPQVEPSRTSLFASRVPSGVARSAAGPGDDLADAVGRVGDAVGRLRGEALVPVRVAVDDQVGAELVQVVPDRLGVDLGPVHVVGGDEGTIGGLVQMGRFDGSLRSSGERLKPLPGAQLIPFAWKLVGVAARGRTRSTWLPVHSCSLLPETACEQVQSFSGSRSADRGTP